VALWYRILKFFLPRFFFSGRGQTTSRVTAPEIGSSQGGASRHGVSTELETFAGPSNVSPFPPEDKYVHFTAESHDRTVTKLTLEHVWIHEDWTSLTSVKFSPDGKSLAVGLIGCSGLSAQKTYIYDMASGRKIWLINLSYDSDLSTLLIGFVVLVCFASLALGHITTAIRVQTMYLSLLMEGISPWGTCLEEQR
jgi:WD40 repeat protein